MMERNDFCVGERYLVRTGIFELREVTVLEMSEKAVKVRLGSTLETWVPFLNIGLITGTCNWELVERLMPDPGDAAQSRKENE